MEARPVAWRAMVNVMSDNPQPQLFSNGMILPRCLASRSALDP